MQHINIQPNSGFKGFVQAIAGMAKQVWPGAWAVIVGVITAVYLTDPGLNYLTRDAWLTGHILLLIGLIAATLGIYNRFNRANAAIMTIALWLGTGGVCYLAEGMLQALLK